MDKINHLKHIEGDHPNSNDFKEPINQLDKDGRKTGYWEEEVDELGCLRKGHYIEGKKDSYWKYYTLRHTEFYAEGCYKEDKQVGLWRYLELKYQEWSTVCYIEEREIKIYGLTANSIFDKNNLSYRCKLGELDSIFRKFDINGNIIQEGCYKEDEKVGLWRTKDLRTGKWIAEIH